MNDADPLTAFYLALDEMPGDRVTMLALADWYEEHGNADAADCLRWAVREVRRPFRYGPDDSMRVTFEKWQKGWYWWAKAGEGLDWGHPATCGLAEDIWRGLKHTFDYSPSVFKEYPSFRAAFEALVAVWARRRASPDGAIKPAKPRKKNRRRKKDED